MDKIRNHKMPDGKVIRGIELNFDVDKEIWNEYTLEDGTKLRIKNSLIRAIRVYDDNDEPVYSEDGTPTVVTVTSTFAVSQEYVAE